MTTHTLNLDSMKLTARVATAFMDSHRLAYAQIDPDLSIVEVSLNFLAMVNRPGNDVTGVPILSLLWEFVGTEIELSEIMQGRTSNYRLEYVRIARADGSTSYCSFHVIALDDQRPECGLLLLVEDVTDKGELQQGLVQDRNELRLVRRELAKANEELHRLNQLKSLFLSMAAHDIRTPLTSIRGYSTLLLNHSSLMPPEHVKLLRIISVQSEKLNRLISDLLDVGQIEQGQIVIKPSACELGAIIREVVDSVEAYAFDQQKQIKIEMPERPLLLWADPEAIWRILYNLVSNAIKYTQAGSLIRINAQRTASETTFQVSDNGRGMSETQVSNLFQLYYRTEEAVSGDVSGTGIGLFIVKTLVEAHGGHIDVDSRIDHGSTFKVSLPTQS